jgi:5-methylcytosine-specific restriction endonuclease McrA
MIIPPKIWHQVFDRAKGYCEYCGEDLLISRAAYASAQVDHVLARAKDGEDKIENLRLACSLCNSSLSRYNVLTTFDARKKHIESQLETHQRNYREKCSKLRQPVTIG